MKAIVTKYLPCTETRGSKIKATAEGVKPVTIPYPHELSGEEVHRAAATELCRRNGWSGELVGVVLPDQTGYAFFFATGKGGSMSGKHAPGPWHLGRRAGNPAVYGVGGEEIAEILHGLTPEWRENARLISAAPEMLDALRELCTDPYLDEPINAGRMSKARAAIAKAERGEA